MAGNLVGAVKELEAIFTFPKDFPQAGGNMGMRVWQVEERPWSGTGENPDPWCQEGQRRRKHNTTRAKVLVFCLRLQSRILNEVMQGAAAAEQAARSSLGSTGATALRELCEGRPSGWEALHCITGLIIAIVRGLAPDPNHRFWTAFHLAFIHALGQGFGRLLEAKDGSGRPFLDWTLFAMLRSCCLGLRSRAVDVGETKLLEDRFVAAAAQLQAYASRAGNHHAAEPLLGPNAPGTLGAAEGLFQLLAPQLPPARGRWGSSAETPSPAGRAGQAGRSRRPRGVVLEVDSDPDAA